MAVYRKFHFMTHTWVVHVCVYGFFIVDIGYNPCIYIYINNPFILHNKSHPTHLMKFCMRLYNYNNNNKSLFCVEYGSSSKSISLSCPPFFYFYFYISYSFNIIYGNALCMLLDKVGMLLSVCLNTEPILFYMIYIHVYHMCIL